MEHRDSAEGEAFKYEVTELAQNGYRHEVRERRTADITPLRRLDAYHEDGRPGEFRLSATFESGFSFHQIVRRPSSPHYWNQLVEETERNQGQRYPRSHSLTYEVHRWFAEALEDIRLELACEEADRQFHYIVERTTDRDILSQAAARREEAIHRLREHQQARRPLHHHYPPETMRLSRSTATEVRTRQQDGERRLRQQEAEMRLHWMRELRRADFMAWDVSGDGGSAARKEAQARGLKLLRENLSVDQRAEYDAREHFHVIGGDTGTRYRILHGRQINIRQLGEGDKIVAKLCFLPAGNLVEGDVMLAQKFALELQEKAALKIANRFPPDGEFQGMEASMTFVDEYQRIGRRTLSREELFGTFPPEEPRGTVRAPSDEELLREREMYQYTDNIMRRSPNSRRRYE